MYDLLTNEYLHSNDLRRQFGFGFPFLGALAAGALLSVPFYGGYGGYYGYEGYDGFDAYVYPGYAPYQEFYSYYPY
ncbi:hypothetical protein SRABI96_02153 [Peribacillus sp. Bi96]|uniref:hypothetical protein n=1 Tax=unclassified Peribacillus TaxID=2675266 RepID=UPI001DFB3FB9|nr:hypothetical protein [Peribacillus sp. Bi96]CAH0210519.1 hypothetical protein SRABI96_02153 [Peribacillus sp. Bi96]